MIFFLLYYTTKRGTFVDANVILKCLHKVSPVLRKSLVPDQREGLGAVHLRHACSDKQLCESLVRRALDISASGTRHRTGSQRAGFPFLLGS